MKTKLFFVLISLLLIASCNKEDKLIPKPDPAPTPDSTATPGSTPTLPIAEGETHWMILTCTKAVNDAIKLAVNAAEADKKDVWIDLNANGEKEEGEAVTEFGNGISYNLGAQTIVVYGKVSKFWCRNSELTSLDVSSNAALEVLECYKNKISSLDVSKNPKLVVLKCGNNDLAKLNLSKNTALKELHCDNTNLTQLDLSKNTELRFIICQKNSLTQLKLTNHQNLVYINVCNNKIKKTKMQDIVDALPRREENDKGTFEVFAANGTNEENIITKKQVDDLRPKNWKVRNSKGFAYDGQ